MMKKDGKWTYSDWDTKDNPCRMINVNGERWINMTDLIAWLKKQGINKFIETSWLTKVFVKLKNSKGK